MNTYQFWAGFVSCACCHAILTAWIIRRATKRKRNEVRKQLVASNIFGTNKHKPL